MREHAERVSGSDVSSLGCFLCFYPPDGVINCGLSYADKCVSACDGLEMCIKRVEGDDFLSKPTFLSFFM